MVASIALAMQIAGSNTGPFIPGTKLTEDIVVLKEALTTIHAGLYRYQTPAQLEAEFESLRQRFADGANQGEVFLALSEFTAKIKCGHTFPSFWNQPVQTQKNLFMAKDKLPVAFRWVDQRMIVTRNDSTSALLAPGTEITKINGVRSKIVLQRLMKLVKGDGSNDSKRVAELELQDRKQWEAFDVYFSRAFKPGPEFKLEVKDLSGRTKETLVEAIDQKTRDANRKAHTPPVVKDGVEWQWSWENEKTARLTMPSWAIYNSKWDWKGFVKEKFIELQAKKAENLILDIRGNAGGTECGDEFLRYLLPKETPFPAGTTFIRYQKIPKTLVPHISTWDRSFYDWSAQTKPGVFVPALNSLAYQIRAEDSVNAERGGLVTPLEPQFRGRLFVLVDAECSSATFQFAQQVRSFRLGTIVGQPTGGNKRGINGGAIFFTTLPNSQIELDIPIIAYLPATPQPDEGLRPDVTVKVTREDLAAGKDSVLEKTLKMIGASGENPSVSRP